MDFQNASKELNSSTKIFVNSDEWADEWEEYWVIFIDLIAFANRCLISPGITLNNIIRFHRAVSDALTDIDDIIKYQFTDACYVLTKDTKTALIVAANIQNECLLHNHIQIENLPHTMFYQMIVPKVVISKGNVLRVKKSEDLKNFKKYIGISPEELLAGDGIVKAYYLEKKTTGGLISAVPEHIKELRKCGSGESKIKTNSLYKAWRKDYNNFFFSHDGVVDIPWLVLQPRQKRKGILEIESEASFRMKLMSFNYIWRSNFTEHVAEKTPTETLKQYGGALTHLCELVKMYLTAGNKSWDLIDIVENMNKI